MLLVVTSFNTNCMTPQEKCGNEDSKSRKKKLRSSCITSSETFFKCGQVMVKAIPSLATLTARMSEMQTIIFLYCCRQSVKKFEKMKRDLDKVQSDFGSLARERNDAVSQLTKEMKEIERLEAQRKGLFDKIDTLERQKSERTQSTDVTKSTGDLNMKLKMEIGQAKSENEKLSKDKSELSDKLVVTKSTLRDAEAELKTTKTKYSEASESCTTLKNLLEATQTELKKTKDGEMGAKMDLNKTRKEMLSTSDGTSKVSKELDRVDKERKEGIQKIQTMHQEIRDIKTKLSDFEANKAKEIKKLQDSLTESLKSNKKVQDNLDSERSQVNKMEDVKATLEAEAAAFKKEKVKAETETKNLATILEKRKVGEKELETMVKDLKEKLDKYDNDKKSALKGEKYKRESVNARFESEKKDLEEKLEKMKLQFEKAAIESRKAMSRLEEENAGAKNIVADAQVTRLINWPLFLIVPSLLDLLFMKFVSTVNLHCITVLFPVTIRKEGGGSEKHD
jgi:chromosome segregation ATPase